MNYHPSFVSKCISKTRLIVLIVLYITIFIFYIFIFFIYFLTFNISIFFSIKFKGNNFQCQIYIDVVLSTEISKIAASVKGRCDFSNMGWISTRLTELKLFQDYMANFSPGWVQTGGKSQPGLKRSSLKMELFRFFEEFILPAGF
jgi:hypothetical protein